MKALEKTGNWWLSHVSFPKDVPYDEEDGNHNPFEDTYEYYFDDSAGEGQTIYVIDGGADVDTYVSYKRRVSALLFAALTSISMLQDLDDEHSGSTIRSRLSKLDHKHYGDALDENIDHGTKVSEFAAGNT